MPLSHLTLTVSHLPTSTSFFLSCLQPLGYKFIGRHDEYIGFGSKADEPADFWLAQEQPGTPAGAAHIAFPAPSKEAVNTFFISALKAGGKIHGEPKCRDPETGYFSAAVVDFDGNSIEAVYRPDHATTSSPRSEAGSVARSERTRGPSALQTIKNGSVVSRARSVRTTEDRAVQAAIENIPASRVKMLAPQQQQAYQQQQQQQQQAYAPAQQSSDNSISAKTIIGTLLGATAGAALAYAMIKGDSSSNSSSPPQSSAPVPAPAPSQYIQQPPPPQQQPQQPQQPQQLLQQQPHQMSMSLPMLMPMLGPAPGYQDQTQQQQPVYRALEAPPTVMAPSQAARSVYTANDAISAYTRSSAAGPKSKSPRADTIYEETEYYPPITEGTPRSLYSQEASTINGGSGSGVRRTSNGSVYATRELPIRAIEYGMSTVSSQQSSQSQSQSKVRSKSYPCDPSTFISSYAETRQLQQQGQQQGHIIGEAESDFSSISTIKPVPATKSVASSHRSSVTKSSSKHSSSHRHEEDLLLDTSRSVASSNRTAHKVALPDSRPGSTYTSATKASKRSSASTIKETRRDHRQDRDSLVDAYDIPLPASAAPSTVFLDAVVDITPEDSISQVGISHHHSNNHTDSKSSSGRSHRSRSGPSSQSQSQAAASTASKRDKDVADSGSKFDQPIKPSDSISQVSSNHHRSHHSSHHSYSGQGGHRGSSRVSGERMSVSGKKSHSGGSVRSGHY